MGEELAEFPVGARLADRWTIRETLCGGPDRGMFRADGPTLVTMGPPQPLSHDELASRFAYPVDGVTRILGVTSIRHAGARYDALVEVEPSGSPLTVQRPGYPREVARSLAAIVARAHAAGVVLGGIRPELVYSDGVKCTGLAPRAEPFLARSEQRSHGVPPCFLEVYLSPEVLSLDPATEASDVFSLCATIVYLLDGAPPFVGDTVLDRLSAAMRGLVRPVAIDLGIRAGLAMRPGERPDADTVLRTLS